MNNDFQKYNDLAEILKVVAHPVRLCILKGLLDTGDCNVGHMQACLNIPQSTVSQHLQKLRAAGLVKGTRRGLEITYKLCTGETYALVKAIFQPTLST